MPYSKSSPSKRKRLRAENAPDRRPGLIKSRIAKADLPHESEELMYKRIIKACGASESLIRRTTASNVETPPCLSL
jgi:hypothetical protein